MEHGRRSARALALALAASVAVVLGSPYIGQARAAVQEAFPAHYRTLVTAVVVVGLAAAVAAAASQIRDRRFLRYGFLAAAFLTGGAYAAVSRTGIVDQDLVEQFHFVEYGVLTFLFYRVWRHRSDLARLVLPGCAAFTAGVADEWLQWFVPTRVGEFHDLLINGAAAVSGTLFSVGVDPPPGVALPPDRPTRRALAAGLSLACVATALFVHTVHLGYVISEPGVGRFRSAFSIEALDAAAADRVRHWRTAPPVIAEGLAREDHYFSEARWHLQRRNDAREDGDAWSAWNENLILERFYWPLLELGNRWPPDDSGAPVLPAAASDGYVSEAEPYPILAVPAALWWLVVTGVVMVLWLIACRDGGSPAGSAHV